MNESNHKTYNLNYIRELNAHTEDSVKTDMINQLWPIYDLLQSDPLNSVLVSQAGDEWRVDSIINSRSGIIKSSVQESDLKSALNHLVLKIIQDLSWSKESTLH